ncbi:uncharacterized protein LOC135843644 isoform X2 [Planococcus citri]
MPEAVQNGEKKGAVLDCLYTLSSQELSKNSGLVVKWFFNRSPNPVYQWIHNQKPQDAGILKGRLKLDYKASNNHSSMYRALFIVTPTVELSGEYKCLVSTYHDEDFSKKHLLVYQPERRMDFFHSRQDMDKINVSCRVEGVFPKPKLYLFKDPDRADNIPEEEVTINMYERSGYFDVTTSAIFNEAYLESPTVFDCEMKIPGTSYFKRKTLLYFPGAMESLSSKVSGSAVYVPLQVIYVLLISMCCFSTFYSRWS